MYMGMKKIILIVIGLLICSITANAQHKADTQIDSLQRSHRITFIGDGTVPHQDSVRAILDRFYIDQFRHFQDPRAPYFLFMSKDSKFALGIGGVVRMRGWYDWGGVIPYNGFIPQAISVPRNDIARRKISTTPDDIEKIEVIEELLLDESSFFNLDIQTFYGILEFLGVDEDDMINYYNLILSFENFQKIPSVRVLDENIFNDRGRL